MKILAIGNSFSEDATALLQLVAPEIFVRNLHIPACSLQRHCVEIQAGEPCYVYEENGADCLGRLVTLKEALMREKWDFITVQQASRESGLPETYFPYLSELIAYVKKFSDAEIVFHQTWAYEHGATHPNFSLYGNDTNKMWEAIKSATVWAAKRENLRIIPVGEMIAGLRGTPVFDSKNGGLNITRDGFHLSINYGRYAAALVWCYFFTGKTAAVKEYDSEPFRTIYRVFCERIKG